MYDKFRNLACEYKNKTPRQLPDTPDPPMTHLLCQCTHPTIEGIHTACTQQIQVPSLKDPPAGLSRGISSLTGSDSRAWACLIPEELNISADATRKLVHILLPHTIPAVREMWKLYCSISHPAKSTKPRHHLAISTTGHLNVEPGPTPPKRRVKVRRLARTTPFTQLTLSPWLKAPTTNFYRTLTVDDKICLVQPSNYHLKLTQHIPPDNIHLQLLPPETLVEQAEEEVFRYLHSIPSSSSCLDTSNKVFRITNIHVVNNIREILANKPANMVIHTIPVTHLYSPHPSSSL